MAFQLIDKRTKDLLLFGYSRQNNQNICLPVVLVELFKQYYDDFSHYKLENNKFKQFIKTISQTSYSTHHISNFIIQSRQDQVSLDISLSMNPFVSHSYWRMRYDNCTLCLTFQTSHTLFPLNILGYDIHYIIYGNLLNKTVEDTQYISIKDSEGEAIKTPYSINEIKSNNFKLIDLHYYFEIVSIKYNSMKTYRLFTKTFTKDEMHKSGIKINVNNLGNWNIRSNIRYYQNCSWRTDTSTRKQLDICVSAYSLPFHVKSFKLRCYVKISRGSQTKCEIKNDVKSCTVSMDYYSAFLQSKSLTISISMEIMKIYNINGKSIKKSNWSKYGFVCK